MTQLITVDRATLEQIVETLESIFHALPLDKSTTKTCYAVNNYHRDTAHTALTAGRAALANAEPANSYDLAKRADNGGQP